MMNSTVELNGEDTELTYRYFINARTKVEWDSENVFGELIHGP